MPFKIVDKEPTLSEEYQALSLELTRRSQDAARTRQRLALLGLALAALRMQMKLEAEEEVL